MYRFPPSCYFHHEPPTSFDEGPFPVVQGKEYYLWNEEATEVSVVRVVSLSFHVCRRRGDTHSTVRFESDGGESDLALFFFQTKYRPTEEEALDRKISECEYMLHELSHNVGMEVRKEHMEIMPPRSSGIIPPARRALAAMENEIKRLDALKEANHVPK